MIVKAIEKAYKKMHERNWDKIYYSIDLHDVCLKSNYESGGYEFFNKKAKEGLYMLSNLEESVLIAWSSCHPGEHSDILDFFEAHDIHFSYFNENPLEPSTKTGDFTDKFYFSVLIDDKAGFDPDIHWQEIIDHFKVKNENITN